MKWWIFLWLVSFVYHMFSQNCVSGAYSSTIAQLQYSTPSSPYAETCVNLTDIFLKTDSYDDTIKAIQNLETFLGGIEVNGTISLAFDNFVALVFKPSGPFKGLTIYSSEIQAGLEDVPNSTVTVKLPEELDVGLMNKIIFSNIKTNKSVFGDSYDVYDQRLVILSVLGKHISGLQEHVNITIKSSKDINEMQEPSCQFFNFSTKEFSQDGCFTLWTCNQSNITCSCNHLTCFAVLMVPISSVSAIHQKILTYISLIGCSLSIFALNIAVFLFIINRKLREDVSMKVHINLVFALILLYVHFLLSQAAVVYSSTWLCFYIAIFLHYFLLATFSWMALEGFNLYLYVIKIFDIYITRYLVKLSVVGWGVPAIIVSVMVIIERGFYGLLPLGSNIAICYITNDNVKMGTTVGFISLVFLFNTIIYGITVKRTLNVSHKKELGQINPCRINQSICPLLGLSALLGITWGLTFFSFGNLKIPSLYLFCIVNSLQGFFIFLWFVMSVRKTQKSTPKASHETNSKSS